MPVFPCFMGNRNGRQAPVAQTSATIWMNPTIRLLAVVKEIGQVVDIRFSEIRPAFLCGKYFAIAFAILFAIPIGITNNH